MVCGSQRIEENVTAVISTAVVPDSSRPWDFSSPPEIQHMTAMRLLRNSLRLSGDGELWERAAGPVNAKLVEKGYVWSDS